MHVAGCTTAADSALCRCGHTQPEAFHKVDGIVGIYAEQHSDMPERVAESVASLEEPWPLQSC